MEDLMSENMYHEELLDYPYAVLEWEEQMEIRATAQEALDEAAKKIQMEQQDDEGALIPGEDRNEQIAEADSNEMVRKDQHSAELDTVNTAKRHADDEAIAGAGEDNMGRNVDVSSESQADADSHLNVRDCWRKSHLPEGRLTFSPCLAFVYVLEK
jgi:hypothetical protein